jgi:purine-binding chemotaxis protein CheW
MSGIHVRLRVGDESYAVPVEHVLEVAELGDVAPVPGAPPTVLGVRNLHGEVVPVFDLAAVLGIARDAGAGRLLVAEDGGRHAGLAVDEVSDVDELPDASEETESDFLAGAVVAEEGLIGVIDVGRLFQSLAQTRS